MGKEQDNANQKGGKDTVKDEEAFLLRMIIICNSRQRSVICRLRRQLQLHEKHYHEHEQHPQYQ
jgi:hypothetical protein